MGRAAVPAGVSRWVMLKGHGQEQERTQQIGCGCPGCAAPLLLCYRNVLGCPQGTPGRCLPVVEVLFCPLLLEASCAQCHW